MASACEILVRVWSFVDSLMLTNTIVPSDMDLCCLIESEEPRSATELVMKLGDLLERGKVLPLCSVTVEH